MCPIVSLCFEKKLKCLTFFFKLAMNLVFVESEGGHWRLHVASVSADKGSDLVHPHLPFSSRGV